MILSNAAGQVDNSMNSSSADVVASAGIQGLWSINLKGTQQLTVALHQSGESLFGSAKSETNKPWNAVVMGDLSGNHIDLTMASIRDSSLVSLRLTGTVHNKSIKGTFIQADDQGNADMGMFTAILTNPDLSAYAPAKVESEVAPAASSNDNPSKPSSQTVSQPVSQTTQPTVVGDPKYRDVHSMAGTVPESLGVGFIGDGTMGAGGMGVG